MKRMICSCILTLLIVEQSSAQWLRREANTLGNWKAMISNSGILFNNATVAGARWHQADLIFGAGIWIGALTRSAEAGVSLCYNPNSGLGDFIPGSFFSEGALLDSSPAAKLKYVPMLSSQTPQDVWPMRAVDGRPVYIDDPYARATAGAPYFIGDEDIFIIYKNTDPNFRTQQTDKAPILEFEIRTQAGFWRSGPGADIIVVKNQITYLGNDTVKDPVVALAMDGDINSRNSTFDGAEVVGGFNMESVSGAYFSIGDQPEGMLGIYLLRGTNSGSDVDAGMTTLQSWSIINDPATASKRYAFMTAGTFVTDPKSATYDSRALIASASSTPLAPGDVIYFDYALAGYQPSDDDPIDSIAIIETGKFITDLYRKNDLSSLDVRPHAQPDPVHVAIKPNPVEHVLTVLSPQIIRQLRVHDVLGKNMFSHQGTETIVRIDVAHFPPGLYFVYVNDLPPQKIVKQ